MARDRREPNPITSVRNQRVVLFGLLAALLIYVFVSAPVTVTLDGYSHLYGATALRWMWRGLPEAHSTFSYNSFLLPNWLTALLLAGLSKVVPAELALKLLVISIGALFVCGLYFCVDAASRSAVPRAQLLIVMLPLTLNGFLMLGYYGFLISTSLCLLVLGLLLRHGIGMPLRLQCTSAGLLLLAYAAHPFPVAVSLLFPAAYVLADAVAHRRALGSCSKDRAGRSFPLALLASTRANAPAAWPWLLPLGFLSWFSLRLVDVEAAATNAPASGQIPRSLAWARDAALSVSPGSRAAVLPIAVLALLLLAVILDRRKLVERDPVRFSTLAALVVATALLSMVGPDRVGDGSGIVMRLLFHAALFFVLLAFASAAARPRLLTVCSVIAALSVIGFAWQYRVAARRLAPAVAEARSVMESLPDHSRVLIMAYRMTPLCEGGPLLKRTFPERHAALAGALEKELIVLNEYQAHTSHFPLRYRDDRYSALVDEFNGYSDVQRTGWLHVLESPSEVDYVVEWGVSGDPLCRSTVRAPYEYSLSGAFERVRLEEGFTRVALWRRRE
jgi:hypothetical protein